MQNDVLELDSTMTRSECTEQLGEQITGPTTALQEATAMELSLDTRAREFPSPISGNERTTGKRDAVARLAHLRIVGAVGG